MIISPAGLREAEAQTTFRARTSLIGGRMVIGFGHAATAKAGMVISRVEARALLRRDLEALSGEVEAILKRGLLQAEFDQMVLFAWQVGIPAFKASAVLRTVNVLGKGVVPAATFDAIKTIPVQGGNGGGLPGGRGQTYEF